MKNIDWTTKKTAHGFATNIPRHLDKLASPLAEERTKAYWSIDNHAILQSDLYEAAYYLIQPLVELLKIATEKKEILNLIIEIANGYAPSAQTITLPNGQTIPLMKACQDALYTHLKDFITLKTTSQPQFNELFNELIEACNPPK